MPRLIELTPNRTYATKANAIKAVNKVFKEDEHMELWYFIHQSDDGRFFPVFVGERAIQKMAHLHFNVVA